MEVVVQAIIILAMSVAAGFLGWLGMICFLYETKSTGEHEQSRREDKTLI